MKKDFKDSYEQKSWEAACRMHAMYTDFIRKTKAGDYYPPLLDRWKKEKEKLEEKYPCLKKPFP